MYAVANGTQRSDAHDELYALGRLLTINEFTVMRIVQHITVSSATKNPEAVVSVCQRAQASLNFKYRPDRDVVWSEGTGAARGGTYFPAIPDSRYSTAFDGWFTLDRSTGDFCRYHQIG